MMSECDFLKSQFLNVGETWKIIAGRCCQTTADHFLLLICLHAYSHNISAFQQAWSPLSYVANKLGED